MPKTNLKREDEAREMVLDRLSTADNARSDYASRAVENEKLYHNIIDETENPFFSNISIPWPYIITESYLGKCIQVLAATMPYVHVVEEDDDSRPKAKRVERDANMVLYKQKWPILSYKTYKEAFIKPCAWLLEKPWGMLDGTEMPLFQLANWFHVWPNPSCLDISDPDFYVIYECFVPKWYIMEMYKGNTNYKNLTKIETYDGETLSQEEQEIRAFKSLADIQSDKYSELVQVYYYWSWKDYVVVTNGRNVIRDDEENFLGKIPLRPIIPIPLHDEFYGMSILEQGKQLFAEVNENRNQFNDAAWLMLNPQYIVNRDTADLKVKNISAKAGNIIWTSDVNAIVPQRQDWNLLQMCLNRQNAIYQDIMNYSNAFPQFRGQPAPGQETATEYLGMRSAGELRSDTYNLLLAMMGVETLVKDIVDYKKMFMIKPSEFYYWPEQQIRGATPEDYTGNFTFKAFASFKGMQELERKQLIEAMTLVFGANGAFLPYVMPKADEWLERLLDSFPHIRSPEQLKLGEQDRITAMTQSALQQLMQQYSGGGEEPLQLGERAMRMPEQEPNAPTGPMLGNISQGT